MKAYKKLATIAPIAVLSTSILFTPAIIFAAEKQAQPTTVSQTGGKAAGIRTLAATDATVTIAEFENWVNTVVLPKANEYAGSYSNPDESVKLHLSPVKYSYEGSSDIKVATTNVGDVSPETVLLGTNDNRNGNLVQTTKTASQTITNTSSFTETNTEGASLTLGYEFGITLKSPGEDLIGGADITEKLSISASANYSHSTSNTMSKSEAVTFPSIDIAAEPHTVVTAKTLVYKQEYSGSDTHSIVTVDATLKGQRATENGPEGQGLYAAILNLVNREGLKLPSYLTIDEEHHKLVLHGLKIDFTGVYGFNTETVFETKDSNTGKTIEMSSEEYNNPQVRTQKLAQIR